jgi:hypothetical protein
MPCGHVQCSCTFKHPYNNPQTALKSSTTLQDKSKPSTHLQDDDKELKITRFIKPCLLTWSGALVNYMAEVGDQLASSIRRGPERAVTFHKLLDVLGKLLDLLITWHARSCEDYYIRPSKRISHGVCRSTRLVLQRLDRQWSLGGNPEWSKAPLRNVHSFLVVLVSETSHGLGSCIACTCVTTPAWIGKQESTYAGESIAFILFEHWQGSAKCSADQGGHPPLTRRGLLLQKVPGNHT